MPFGRSKKTEAAEEEDRSALFNKRKPPARPSFTNANPYATASADPYAAAPQDPYAAAPQDPYTPQQSRAPPPYSSDEPSTDRYRQEKSPVPPGGYGGGLPGGPRDRYAPPPSGPPSGSRYGTGSNNNYDGYGGGAGDRYGASAAPPPGGSIAPPTGGSRYGSGGYGGLGPAPSARSGDNDDSNRSALFGSAPTRLADSQQNNVYASNNYAGNNYAGNNYAANNTQANQSAVSEWESGRGPEYGRDRSRDYQQKSLTAEEIEEEEVAAAKQEIRAIKQQDVSSTRNALRIAQQAEETGRATLERLGAQGERIHNTERNLDLASNQNRLAAEKARELKTLNRSMFAVHVANPFTSKQRIEEREATVLEQARLDREERDATRTAAWSSNARAQKQAMQLNKPSAGIKKGSLAERSKYQFEADSEDEAMEDEIDQNLDLLHGAAGRLKNLSLAMGEEVDAQNRHIERIGGKVDKVDDEIALNRSRLDRIK